MASQLERWTADPLNKLNVNVIPTNEIFTVTAVLAGDAPATATNYGKFFTAPFKCKVVKVQCVWGVASTSGTINVERLQGTEALDAGDALLTDNTNAGFLTSATADTVTTGTLTTTTANLELSVGNRLALKDAGTLTSMADVVVTVTLKWLKQ